MSRPQAFSVQFLLFIIIIIPCILSARGNALVPIKTIGYGGLQSIACLPDGSGFLTGSSDHRLRFWDASSGTVTHTFSGHTEEILSIDVSYDGRLAITGGADYRVILWDLSAGALLKTFEDHDAYVTSVAFSNDGNKILSGDERGSIILRDITTDSILHDFDHDGETVAVAFLGGDSAILSAQSDSVKIWDAQTGALLRSFASGDEYDQYEISSDKTRIVGNARSKPIRVLDVNTGEVLLRLSLGHGIKTVSFTPDEATIVTGTIWGQLEYWDENTGERIDSSTVDFGNDIQKICFSRDGSRLFTHNDYYSVTVIDVAKDTLCGSFTGHTGKITALDFSSDGSKLLAGYWFDQSKIWDIQTGKIMTTLSKADFGVSKVDYHPDSPWVLVPDYDKAILLDESSGNLLKEYDGCGGSVEHIGFSLDGSKVFASCRDDSTVRVWDTQSAQQLGIIKVDGEISSAQISPDNERMLIDLQAPEALLYSISTNDVLQSFPSLEYNNETVFTPDGERVLINRQNGLTVFDCNSGDSLLALNFEGSILSLAVSPDGSKLLAGVITGYARLFDLSSGKMLYESNQLPSSIEAAAFSPDGELVALGFENGTADMLRVSDMVSMSGLSRAKSIERSSITCKLRTGNLLEFTGIPSSYSKGRLKVYTLSGRKLLDAAVGDVKKDGFYYYTLPNLCNPGAYIFSVENGQERVSSTFTLVK